MKTSLERERGVLKSKRPADPTEGAAVRYQRCLVMLFLGDMLLPLSAVGMEGGLNSRIISTVDEIVHARNVARMWYGDFGQLSVIDTE